MEMVERQIIGSLLIDQSRIDDMHMINSEMFTDTILGQIFSLYEHAEGKEVNEHVIYEELKSEYWNAIRINALLVEIVNEHNSGISDEYCCEQINKAYRARTIDNILNHTEITPANVDLVIDDMKSTLDSLSKPERVKPKSLSDLAKSFKGNYFKDKDQDRFKTGFARIDKAIAGLDDGDLIILAARPAVGKSALILQLIRKFGREGKKVAYFNLEMGEEQIYQRAVASTSGIDMTRVRLAKAFLNDEKEKFDKGNNLLEEEANVFPFNGTFTINEIRAIQKQYQYDLIAIDYLQLISVQTKRNNRAAEVGDISRGLKGIARDFGVPVIALSQLNRVSEMNKDKEPTMSELRESGDIEQDASVILLMWNPNMEDETEKAIKVEKSRNGYKDREKLYFDGRHMTFSTIDLRDSYTDEEDPPFD